MKSKVKITLTLLGILGLLFGAAKIRQAILRPVIYKQTRFLMDTYCTIQALGPKRATSDAIAAALDRMEEIDQKFNVLNPKSPLYAFNNNNTPISDSEAVYVVEAALSVCNEQKAMFDITLFPVSKVWGFFGGDSMHLPDSAAVKCALSKTGLEKIVFANHQIVKKDTSAKIDLGGVAKGYAIREAVSVLKTRGVTSALIDGGGQIYALGTLQGKPWKVGVRNPRGDGVIGVLKLTNASIATSGDYERFFIQNGVRYCHLIDPSTGYPAHGFLSFSDINADPFLADAWSKLFVLGPERLAKVLEHHPEIQIISISPSGEISYSTGLQKNLEILAK
jgi:FAD:protein FMN transferase